MRCRRQHKLHTVSDPGCGFANLPVLQVNVPHGGLVLGMPQELSDHNQIQPACEGMGSVGMPEVMDADVLEASEFADTPPRPLKIRKVLPFHFARDDIWIIRQARQGCQNILDHWGQGNVPPAGL